MNHREHIARLIAETVKEPPFEIEKDPADLEPRIEVPKDERHGDLAFPCFLLSKDLRKPPQAIAQELGPLLEARVAAAPELESVSVVGPYINFAIDRAGLAARILPSVLSGEYLAPRPRTGRRVMIEYSQPNTHKAFHVGHTRNVALGDALVRIFEWCGDEVVAATYPGDEGAHIAKCLWYYTTQFDGEVPESNRGEFLGELYTKATELLDFKLLTRAPIPGVTMARVTSRRPHPANEKWSVVELDTGAGLKTVVCGGSGYDAGDLVAWAAPGTRLGGREVQIADKKGVESEGMIASVKELGLGRDRDKIWVHADDAGESAAGATGEIVGREIAELLRVPGALPDGTSVLDVMREREAGVASILEAVENGDEKIAKLWRETRQWSLDQFDEIYEWIGARFDHSFFESEVGETGKQLVEAYLEKGVFVRSEGAVGARLDEFGLPFFLLLRSNGTGLYSTKDVALAQVKFEKFNIDHSVYVVDSAQSLHFQQLFKTLELMGFEQAGDCYHLAYEQVVLPDGKMSSRKGNVILFSQLRERLTRKVLDEFLEQYRGEWTDDEIDRAAHRIAVATIRYGMLNQDNGRKIVFDLDEWTSRTGNTGPYLMYAYARTRAIQRKVEEQTPIDLPVDDIDWSLLDHDHEQSLIGKLAEFPDVVQRAAGEHRPQAICIYLYDLAKAFSRMYEQCSVAYAETDALRAARLAIVRSFSSVLKAGLELLGIQPLDRM